MIELIMVIWFGCGILAILFTIIAALSDRSLRDAEVMEAIPVVLSFLFMGPIGLLVIGVIFSEAEKMNSITNARKWRMIRKKERLVCRERQQR